MQLSRGSAILEIFSYEGAPIATLCADPKGSVKLRLPEGVYIAQTQSGRAVFELTNGRLFVCSGAARSAQGTLIFDETPCGSVRVLRQGGGALSLRLCGAAYEASAQGEGVCEFQAVPYGDYVLYENGAPRATLKVSAGSPQIELTLKP